MSQLHRWCNS